MSEGAGRLPGPLVHLVTAQTDVRVDRPLIGVSLHVADLSCESRDSNPDAVRRQILSLLRLPIPPLPRVWER